MKGFKISTQTSDVVFLCQQKVQEVKEEIATSASVPVNMQRLIFRGKVLKDDSPLGDIPGILDGGSTVHMVQRASNAPEAGSGAAGGAARGASTGARAGVRGRPTVGLIYYLVLQPVESM